MIIGLNGGKKYFSKAFPVPYSIKMVGPTVDGYGLDTKKRNQAKWMVTFSKSGSWIF
jgi:hypothetical protein